MKHIEDAIQIEYVARARQLFPWVGDLLYHVPNGGRRDIMTAVRLKKLGVVPGIPDINIDVPVTGYCGMRIEFKKDVKQKPRQNQESIHRQLRGYGYYVAIHFSPAEALEETAFYFTLSADYGVSCAARSIYTSFVK